MELRISKVKKITDKEVILDNIEKFIGLDFSLSGTDCLVNLSAVERDYEYPLMMILQNPKEYKEVVEVDLLGINKTIKKVPDNFEDEGFEFFNLNGESASKRYTLSKTALAVLRRAEYEDNEPKWETVEISDSCSDHEKDFHRVLSELGINLKDPIFVSVTDSISNDSLIPEEGLKEGMTMTIDWVYWISGVSEYGDIFNGIRQIGIQNYMMKDKIVKRSIFIPPFIEGLSAISLAQVNTIRIANWDEMQLWIDAGSVRPDVIPRLITSSGTIEDDPELAEYYDK